MLDTKDNSLLLKTHAVSKSRKAIGSTDGGMARVATLVEEVTSIWGRLRIDALSDTIIRFRYTEGQRELVNNTPVVVGAPFYIYIACHGLNHFRIAQFDGLFNT